VVTLLPPLTGQSTALSHVRLVATDGAGNAGHPLEMEFRMDGSAPPQVEVRSRPAVGGEQLPS